MSFAWFRKYHKPFLWFSVIFTVVVFATFSGLGDLKVLLSGGGGGKVLGEFKLAPTGATKRIMVDEFARVRTELNRFVYVQGRSADLKDDDVWAQIMTVEDARAAGLDVAPGEVAQVISANFLPPGQANAETYKELWNRRMQFPSARDFERFLGNLMIGQRWQQVSEEAARVVDADEIYLRWRTDNEVFDIDAVVIPDLTLEQVADPTPEVLKAWWDALPESTRNARFTQPQAEDIIYAWLPLDAGPDVIAEEKLTALPEPDPSEVSARFEQQQSPTTKRWPDKAELDDEARAVLVRELRLVALAQQAYETFQALAEKSAAVFAESMTAAGLKVVNPEGELGPDGLKVLEGIGDETLPLWLGQRKAGDTHFGYPYGGQNHVEVVYLETVTPSRPLSFEEAHDQVVKAWKEQQRDTPAREFRDLLRARTRALPEVVELLKPLNEAASTRADEQVAAQPDLDEAAREALRKQVLDATEQTEILPRLAEYEHLVWADMPLPEGARRVELTDVSHNYAVHPTGDEAADSVERFLKSNGIIFRLAVNAISDPLRHAASGSTVVVRVVSRSFPDMAAMLADPESLALARAQLAGQRASEVRASFTPERMKVSHELKLLEKTQE